MRESDTITSPSDVKSADLRDAIGRLSADFSVDSAGHPSERDIHDTAPNMLVRHLPVEYVKDEDERGRTFYYNTASGKSTWTHPMEAYYKGWLFMHKGKGRLKMETNRRNSPCTPEEIREMASFFGVNPVYATYMERVIIELIDS